MLPRIIVFVLAALANVIGLDPDLHDPALWFASEATLAVVVAAAVVFFKRASQNITGVMSMVLSLVVGAGLAVAGFFADLFAAGTPLSQALMFGIGAAGGASLFWDLLKAVFGAKSPEPVT